MEFFCLQNKIRHSNCFGMAWNWNSQTKLFQRFLSFSSVSPPKNDVTRYNYLNIRYCDIIIITQLKWKFTFSIKFFVFSFFSFHCSEKREIKLNEGKCEKSWNTFDELLRIHRKMSRKTLFNKNNLVNLFFKLFQHTWLYFEKKDYCLHV